MVWGTIVQELDFYLIAGSGVKMINRTFSYVPIQLSMVGLKCTKCLIFTITLAGFLLWQCSKALARAPTIVWISWLFRMSVSLERKSCKLLANNSITKSDFPIDTFSMLLRIETIIGWISFFGIQLLMEGLPYSECLCLGKGHLVSFWPITASPREIFRLTHFRCS